MLLAGVLTPTRTVIILMIGNPAVVHAQGLLLEYQVSFINPTHYIQEYQVSFINPTHYIQEYQLY